MEKKIISDVDAFIEEAEKGRNIPLSKEDIKRINDLSKVIESDVNYRIKYLYLQAVSRTV